MDVSDLRIRSVTVVDEIGRRLAPAGEADVADRVVADLHQYGTPYLAARSTLPDIIAAMSAAGTTQLDDTYLAIAHALLGDLPEARQALAAVARKAETKPVLVRGDSDRFIEYFRAHFGAAP